MVLRVIYAAGGQREVALASLRNSGLLTLFVIIMKLIQHDCYGVHQNQFPSTF